MVENEVGMDLGWIWDESGRFLAPLNSSHVRAPEQNRTERTNGTNGTNERTNGTNERNERTNGTERNGTERTELTY